MGFPGSSAGKESACNAEDPGSGRSPGGGYPLQYSWTSLVAQMVKYPLAMRETWVQSLGWEDPLEKAMATHSSILAWKIPWIKEPGWLQSMGSQRVRQDWVTSLSFPIMALTPSLIAQFWGLQGLIPFLGYELLKEDQPTTINMYWAFTMCQLR